MHKRSIEAILREALQISPTVLLLGARQVGKSTLCLSIENEYRVFDSLSEREAALNDPIGNAHRPIVQEKRDKGDGSNEVKPKTYWKD